MSANMKMSIDCEIIYKLNEKKILKYNIEMVKLEDYTTTELKKMISSFNKLVKFSAYSKLKKADLINMIRKHPKINVEEGTNAVKLSIKTDEDFEKQKKVKKEKVKKEVKKEVEKLDDVKIVVDESKAKKAGIKIDTKKAEKKGVKIIKAEKDVKPVPKKEPDLKEPKNKFAKRYFKKMEGSVVNKDGKEVKITDKDVKLRAKDMYRDLVFSLQSEEDKQALKDVRSEKNKVMKLINGAKKNYTLSENKSTWELFVERLEFDMTDETLDKNDDEPKKDVFYYDPLNYQRIINYVLKNYLKYM